MPLFFLPVCGYAEIHYRFRFFFSLLKKAQPEIVADVPHRVQKPHPLPLLIVIKDADRYPVLLKSITVFADKKKLHTEIFNKPITENYYDLILPLAIREMSCSTHFFDVKIEYRCRNREFICYNDNYRGLSHAPLPCRISDQPLPNFDGYLHGDLHVHSNYTSDQIEFGPSLSAILRLAQSMGLHFFAACDHSYDLDDLPHNYLQKDKYLRKWQAFQNEVRKLNSAETDFRIIPGEEVSVGNSAGKNVHLLVFNSSRFWPGDGDSGEKWLHFQPTLALKNVVPHLPETAAAFGAHPAARTPFLQRLLINRGNWTLSDMRMDGLSGLQFINGASDEEIKRGLQFWQTLLLEGRKLFLLAGNDAHGSFSRTRQIATPFFSLREHNQHLFGFWRSVLQVKTYPPKVADLLAALKAGNYFVTNGPALRILVFAANKILLMGQTGSMAKSCRLELKSNQEFGPVRRVRLLVGFPQRQLEQILWRYEPTEDIFSLSEAIDTSKLQPPFYLRAEAETRSRHGLFCAYSNPIWLEP